MIDSHCHLNDAKFNGEVSNVVANFLNAGVDKAICVAWDYNSSVYAKQISDEHESVYYTVGVHPDECGSYNEHEIENLILNKTDKLVAVGEIGLDYYHNKENKEQQKQVFISQINLANKHKLPIVIHCRDAFGDTLEILKQFAPFEYGAVMHCYSGSLEFAQQIIKLGIKISFTGTVTYKNAVNLQEVAKKIPTDSFFLETDCPYLSPQMVRGTRNEPKNMLEIATFIANLRDMGSQDLIRITDENTIKFFKLN